MMPLSEKDCLEQVIGKLEAYEQPMTSEQCHNAIKAVQELTVLLRQMEERKRQRKEPDLQLQVIADMRAMMAYHYAIEREQMKPGSNWPLLLPSVTVSACERCVADK